VVTPSSVGRAAESLSLSSCQVCFTRYSSPGSLQLTFFTWRSSGCWWTEAF